MDHEKHLLELAAFLALSPQSWSAEYPTAICWAIREIANLRLALAAREAELAEMTKGKQQ